MDQIRGSLMVNFAKLGRRVCIKLTTSTRTSGSGNLSPSLDVRSFLLKFYPRGNVFLTANVSIYDPTKPSSKKIQPATGVLGLAPRKGTNP
jgi:hypothetical protein